MVLESNQFVAGLGHIPSDWSVKTADEISLKITKGTTPPKEDIVDRPEIPFLRVNNLGFNGALDQKSDFIFVSRNAHEGFLARSMAYPGDILMNIVGPPLGKVSLLGNDFAEYNMNQAIVIYRLHENLIYRGFFLAYLMSDIAQQWLQSRSKKTSGQQNLTIELCKGLPLPIPAFAEQKKIAQILSTWDQAIATTERLLDLAHHQKKALMQQLLTGKKRFTEFKGNWKRVRLGEILNVRKEKQIPDENTPLYSLTIENGVTAKTERYNREFLVKDSDEKKYKIVMPNDIVYNPANLRWGAINYSRISHSVVVSPIYEVLYVKKPDLVCLEFVAQSLMCADQINRFAAMVEGTLVERMAVKIEPFLATKIPFPSSRQEQQKIAVVVSCCEQEIEALQSQLDSLKQEKRGLMQALLTGKRRVSVDN